MQDTLRILGDWDTVGTPNYTYETNIDRILYDRITYSFPESSNFFGKNPQYFSEVTPRNIIISSTDEKFSGSDISVTYVATGTSNRNAVGYYRYDLGAEPNLKHCTIIFPNTYDSGLKVGDTVRLLYDIDNPDTLFPNNTVVGFFIIQNGWNPDKATVDLTQTTFYTDTMLNEDGQIHTVILFDATNSDLTNSKYVIGFEDTVLEKSDSDFNDLIIYINTTGITDSISALKLAPSDPFSDNILVAACSGLYISLIDTTLFALSLIITEYYNVTQVIKCSNKTQYELLKKIFEKTKFEFDSKIITNYNNDATTLAMLYRVPKNKLDKYLYLMFASNNIGIPSDIDPKVNNIVYFQNDYVFSNQITNEYNIFKTDKDVVALNIPGRPNTSLMKSPRCMGDPHFTTIYGYQYTIKDMFGEYTLYRNNYLTVNTLINYYDQNENNELFRKLTFMNLIYIRYNDDHIVVDMFCPNKYYELIDGNLIDIEITDTVFSLDQDYPNSKTITLTTTEMGTLCFEIYYYLDIGDIVNDFKISSNTIHLFKAYGLLVDPSHCHNIPYLNF